ncbi:hypothetical protein OA79_05490 [Marinomonas sp. TW1]|nr:hypothetical protein OA79_05490 [Marinomonas sp. TW1]
MKIIDPLGKFHCAILVQSQKEKTDEAGSLLQKIRKGELWDDDLLITGMSKLSSTLGYVT